MQTSVRIDLDAFCRLTRRYGRPSPVGFQARSLQKPRKSVSSTTARCRLSSARGCSLVQHDFNTVYSGPDWKGTPRCLPSSTESAPRWSRNATPPLHSATWKKKKRREGQGKETPVEPLEMSVGWYLRQVGSFRSNKAAPSSVRMRAWILINIILPLAPFTLI